MTRAKLSRALFLDSYQTHRCSDLPVRFRPPRSQLFRYPLGQSRPGRNEMGYSCYDTAVRGRAAWNAGETVGTKRPLTQKRIWAIRFFLDREGRVRDRALFDLAIDSKLRGCEATGNLRAIEILLGHTKIENTVRYLGVDIEDALLLAERTEI